MYHQLYSRFQEIEINQTYIREWWYIPRYFYFALYLDLDLRILFNFCCNTRSVFPHIYRYIEFIQRYNIRYCYYHFYFVDLTEQSKYGIYIPKSSCQ